MHAYGHMDTTRTKKAMNTAGIASETTSRAKQWARLKTRRDTIWEDTTELTHAVEGIGDVAKECPDLTIFTNNQNEKTSWAMTRFFLYLIQMWTPTDFRQKPIFARRS